MELTKTLRRAERSANRHKVPMTHGRLGWVDLVRRTAREIGDDHVPAFAGNLAYHALLSIVPFLTFVLSLLFLMGQESLLTDGVDRLRASGALSTNAAAVITNQVDSLAEAQSGAFGLGVLISILAALWAISGAFRAIMEATNVMYEVEETRGLVRRYLTSIILSVVVAALFMTALAMVVAGPSFADDFGDVGRWSWLVLQWPVLLGFVLLGLALVYYYAPSAEQEFRWVTQGSIIATAVWLVFSL
ncbi:MAG: ribonuclease, partial [Thermoleophilia bacterium]|nr:ribonuclease [Thermoleophilia bacterium]